MRKITVSVAVVVCALCGVTAVNSSEPGFDADIEPQGELTHVPGAVKLATLDAFQSAHPHAGIHRTGGRITRVYAGPLSSGPDAFQSADNFVNSYINMFGVQTSDLRLHSMLSDRKAAQPMMYDVVSGTYKFTLVYYSEFKDDIPVFRSDLRLLVRNDAGHPVVLAASSLRGVGAFEVDQSVASRQFDPAVHADTGMTSFTTPETVIWAGIEDMKAEPTLAVTFIGDNYEDPTAELPERWRFVCDAATGEVLHKEDMILFVDVNGSVSGKATPGPKAMQCTLAVPMPFPYAEASIQGGSTTHADANGDFTIPHSGTSSVTVLSPIRGTYFVVTNYSGSEDDMSMVVTPPGPADFLHNPSTTEFVTAQANGYVNANEVRDWTLSVNPSYPTIATQTSFPVVVNRTDGYCPGNAWYDGSSINFCQASSGYGNTSFASVSQHEYGHHIVATGGSGQGEYGEGMSDCIAMLIADDPGLGYGFYMDDCDTPLRDADNTCQYTSSGCSTCGSAIHDCGRLLSGCVWDVREQLQLTEPADALAIVSNLTVNSVLLHSGTSINAQIAIDFLTLDDDDGNIGNGTPHYPEICAGFGAHNMDCPPLLIGLNVSPETDFSSGGDGGGPFLPASKNYTLENMGPSGSIDYELSTTATWLDISGASGTLPSVGSTATATVSINGSADALPDGVHNATVLFTNTTDGVGNTVRFVNLSIGIPDNCSSATVVCPGTYSDSTVAMTNDGSASCGTTDSAPDMWYSYTPDSSSSATFSLCSGTTYDAALSIHTGCPGTVANEVGCDDDGCGTTGGPATVTIPVTASQTYLVRVTGYNGSSGNFTLTISGPDCAAIALDISYPSGKPSSLLPGVDTDFDVEIEDGEEQYVPDSGTLHYRYDGGAFQTAPLTPLGGTLFQATLTPPDCDAEPEYYISAQGDSGTTATSPGSAPSDFFSAPVLTSSSIFTDDFETDNGWTVSGSPEDGQWTRGVPIDCDRGDPPADSDGSGQCWLTDNSSASSCNSDVDGGTTILTSPPYDMSSGGTILYDYWLDEGPGSIISDSLTLEIATNAGGTNWTLVRTYTTPGYYWRTDAVSVGTEVEESSTIRLRFSASDLGESSLIECAIDNLIIDSSECVFAPCDIADGDMDDSGSTNALDIQFFVDSMLGSPTQDELCAGDFNESGGLDSGDTAGFVNALLAP